jgi:hypothetical protein
LRFFFAKTEDWGIVPKGGKEKVIMIWEVIQSVPSIVWGIGVFVGTVVLCAYFDTKATTTKPGE